MDRAQTEPRPGGGTVPLAVGPGYSPARIGAQVDTLGPFSSTSTREHALVQPSTEMHVGVIRHAFQNGCSFRYKCDIFLENVTTKF